jgi:hypothetical protein
MVFNEKKIKLIEKCSYGGDVSFLQNVYNAYPFVINEKHIFQILVLNDEREGEEILNDSDLSPLTNVRVYHDISDFDEEDWMQPIIDEYNEENTVKFEDLKDYYKKLIIIQNYGFEEFDYRPQEMTLEEAIHMLYRLAQEKYMVNNTIEEKLFERIEWIFGEYFISLQTDISYDKFRLKVLLRDSFFESVQPREIFFEYVEFSKHGIFVYFYHRSTYCFMVLEEDVYKEYKERGFFD